MNFAACCVWKGSNVCLSAVFVSKSKEHCSSELQLANLVALPTAYTLDNFRKRWNKLPVQRVVSKCRKNS